MRYGKLIAIAGLLVILALIIACKTKSVDASGGGGGGTGSTPTTPTGTTAAPPASITSTATPTTITVLGTSTITAVVVDSSGNPVVDGTQVSFTLSDSSFGALSNTVATTAGLTGTARTTFTAANKAGTVIVTVLAGTATKSITITINPSSIGSIQFVSAVPQVIGLKGSGQAATSNITFSVKDNNGNNVADGTTVTFVMLGPGGGEYIGNTPGATTALGSTVNGLAMVTLNSGNVAGPVIIIASTLTAGGVTISSSAGQVSIGGGVPSFKHFNLATSKFNLKGLVASGVTADISAFIGDRFGNYNVLQGTAISFYTEAGAIDRQGVADNKGFASVTFRTQAPNPAQVAIWGPSDPLDESGLISRLNGTYSLGIPAGNAIHPRNGWVSVLATVQGEESFLDENGNGLFDSSFNASACPQGYTCECVGGTSIKPADVTRTCAGGANRSEAFIDLGEPFIDVNDDGCRNDAATKNCNGVMSASSDPFEIFIDANNNGVYDPPNGKWDGPSCTTAGCQTSKMIWTPITLAFTGNAAYFAASPATIDMTYGDSQPFTFMVGDQFTNRLVAGTTIKVSATGGGTLTGQTTFTIPDGLPFGPQEISFNLASAATGSGTVPASITIDVTSPDVVGCTIFVNGTFHN